MMFILGFLCGAVTYFVFLMIIATIINHKRKNEILKGDKENESR